MKKCHYIIPTILAVCVAFLSHGQIRIKADTLAMDCREVYQTKKEIFIIKTQSEYENSEFFAGGAGCIPFDYIDFEISILVGYKFQGSNCDRRIQWARVTHRDEGDLIQFATAPNYVCRDLNYRLAWFIVDKPPGEIDISFERIDSR